jgi:O-antigen biosynthesis protein WbqP
MMLPQFAEPDVQARATAGGADARRHSMPGGATSSAGKRLFDILLCLVLLPVVFILIVLVSLAIALTCRGPILYWSDRVGLRNRIFRMPKFRTMNLGTPEVATHLLHHPKAHLTRLGPFLRKTSLDELPQIYSILRGDLSFVGPRPALHNQRDLVALRTERGVHELVPGLTGWAQVNGRDDLPVPVKVEYDREYLQRKSLLFDLKILLRTAAQVLRGSGVTH